MSQACNGELLPVGGGDRIPLIRPVLTIGRRESCDIRLPFPNVSGIHCELTFTNGHWMIKDMGSTNGIKVNGLRVQKKVLHPKDTITIAKRQYIIDYVPTIIQRLEEILEEEDDILSQPLLEKAGLIHPPRHPQRPPGKKGARVEDDFEDEED